MTKKDREEVRELLSSLKESITLELLQKTVLPLSASLNKLENIILGVNGKNGLNEQLEKITEQLHFTCKRLDSLDSKVEGKNKEMDDFIKSSRNWVRGFLLAVVVGVITQIFTIYIKLFS